MRQISGVQLSECIKILASQRAFLSKSVSALSFVVDVIVFMGVIFINTWHYLPFLWTRQLIQRWPNAKGRANMPFSDYPEQLYNSQVWGDAHYPVIQFNNHRNEGKNTNPQTPTYTGWYLRLQRHHPSQHVYMCVSEICSQERRILLFNNLLRQDRQNTVF